MAPVSVIPVPFFGNALAAFRNLVPLLLAVSAPALEPLLAVCSATGSLTFLTVEGVGGLGGRLVLELQPFGG